VPTSNFHLNNSINDTFQQLLTSDVQLSQPKSRQNDEAKIKIWKKIEFGASIVIIGNYGKS